MEKFKLRHTIGIVLLCGILAGGGAQNSFNLENDESSNDYGSYDTNREIMTDLECSKLTPRDCDPAKDSTCSTTERCKKQSGLEAACMATWRNTSTDGVVSLVKGCWMHQKTEACTRDRCISTKANIHKTHPGFTTYFCCCTGRHCNEKMFFHPPPPTPPPPEKIPGGGDVGSGEREPWKAVLFILVPIVVIALLIFGAYYYYRRYLACQYFKQRAHCTENGDLPVPPFSPFPQSAPLLPIQLKEEDVVARGRFGRVYRAEMGAEKVAVKKFPLADAGSWVQEQEIYHVAGMRHHPNILTFIGAEARGAGPETEYWLITTYHPLGSLSDYLKTHTMPLNKGLEVAITMLRGLSFLHEEIVEKGTLTKPTVVHRDFKSKNVLIKSDLTACIGDFGLALKCEHGQSPEDTHGQVGTRRYMAPEVLEGATEFSAIAFRQIDVYAAGLVLWEILSRTIVVPGEGVGEYKLPLEEEVGQHPSLQVLQETVVNNKHRPLIKDSWLTDKRSSVLCQTMGEMWDAEPEARISAGVALERLQGLIWIGTPNGHCGGQELADQELSPLISSSGLTSSPETNV